MDQFFEVGDAYLGEQSFREEEGGGPDEGRRRHRQGGPEEGQAAEGDRSLGIGAVPSLGLIPFSVLCIPFRESVSQVQCGGCADGRGCSMSISEGRIPAE